MNPETIIPFYPFCSLFHYALDEDDEAVGRGFQCGSVMISDGFAVLAAHCLLNFGQMPSLASANTVLIRDRTGNVAQYAVRRYFSHPKYEYPSLYYDIAIAELSECLVMTYSHVLLELSSCF